MAPHKVVVHDVLGTLFDLSAPILELKALCAKGLEGAPEHFAELVVMDWYHAAQRDFTNLSIQGAYRPIAEVFRATLPRVMLQAGLQPDAFASTGSDKALATGGNVQGFESAQESMMGSLSRLTPRKGMQAAFARYAAAGVEAWGATNGSLKLAETIFSNALGQNAAKNVHRFSCDEIRIAKPDPRVYEAVKERIKAGAGREQEEVELWFVATHSWDTFAAKRAGFRTAWVANEEHDSASGVFGQPDIIAGDLDEAAKLILAWPEEETRVPGM